MTLAALGRRSRSSPLRGARHPVAATPQDAARQGRTAYERGDYGARHRHHPSPALPVDRARTEEAWSRRTGCSRSPTSSSKAGGGGARGLARFWRCGPTISSIRSSIRRSAVRFFDDVKRRQDDRLDALESAQREEEERARREEEKRLSEARAKAERVYVERVVEKHTPHHRAPALRRRPVPERPDGQGVAVRRVRGASWRSPRSRPTSRCSHRTRANPTTGHQQFTASTIDRHRAASGAADRAPAPPSGRRWRGASSTRRSASCPRSSSRRSELPERAAPSTQEAAAKLPDSSADPRPSGCTASGVARSMVNAQPSHRRCPARGRRSTTCTRRSRRSAAARRTTSSSPDPLLADSHAHVHFDGRDFNITADRQARRPARQRQAAQEAPPGAPGPS